MGAARVRSRRISLVLALVAGLASCLTARSFADERPPYRDPSQPLDVRVEDLLSRLTIEEKIALLHGDSKFATAEIPRLGIPRRWLSDGPHGVREEISADSWSPAGRSDDFATYMPALMALAATWNTDLARSYGEVLGDEALRRGKHILLGPGVNIMRTPLCGRSFEYLGEDPLLAARLAVPYIQGLQSRDVAACVKHFAANSQERDRREINVEMDERTLREIYLPAFRAAVQEGGAWAVMGAYNLFRGQHCSHNEYLLNRILKGEWGFRGLVMSDWNAATDTREAVLHGLDLEMGTEGRTSYDNYYLARPFLDGLRRGEYALELLDDKVRRSLRVMIATRALDGRGAGALNTPEHQAAARRVAEEGFVLLKNEAAALPLDLAQVRSIAVIGENAVRRHAHGGGAAAIKAFYEVTPLEGIIERALQRATVTFSLGYSQTSSATDAIEQAVRAARQSDVAIVVAGLNHTRGLDAEGTDRTDLRLPYGQDELIMRVSAANPRTIVVLVSGTPIVMDPWVEQVPAVVQAWYAGMEGGRALARVLFGDVSPSGKLPCTFPRRLEDTPTHVLGAAAHPGAGGTSRYDEGLFVGYRHYDAKAIAPLFPFGHGLSYTRFEYSGLKLTRSPAANDAPLLVELTLANIGEREAAEVVQVYVEDLRASLPRPVRELKGFRKVFLKPGETQAVAIPLGREAFEFYEPTRGGWLAERGLFRIHVGGSSRDIRLAGDFRLPRSSFRR
jgi:beta-glucosidase